MEFETSNLSIKFSHNIQDQNLWKHIVKFFKYSDTSYCTDFNKNNDEFIHVKVSTSVFPNDNFSNALIPFCIISPKFDYQSHLDKVKNFNILQQYNGLECEGALSIVVLFVTIEYYDTAKNSEVEVDEVFGHKAIDLVFYEIKKYYLRENIRCVVIWIGTRDFLSQESFFSPGNTRLSNNICNKSNINSSDRNFVDQSSLDKCIISLLINDSIDSIETKNEFEAAQYLDSLISSISEVQKRLPSSKYKPRISSSQIDNVWTTQLLQIPGLSEDSARAIEEMYKTPNELILYLEKNVEKHGLHLKDGFNFCKVSNYDIKLEADDSNWFDKLTNISFLCSKGLNNRRLGKARAKKLVLLYSGFSDPTDILTGSNI